MQVVGLSILMMSSTFVQFSNFGKLVYAKQQLVVSQPMSLLQTQDNSKYTFTMVQKITVMVLVQCLIYDLGNREIILI